MIDQHVHTLVYSSRRGRYCLDDAEHGHDLTHGEWVSVEVLGGVWIDGAIEHSVDYTLDTPGLYTICDEGMQQEHRSRRAPLTEEGLYTAVRRGMHKGLSMRDAISAARGQTVGVFRGYYFVSVSGHVLGLCTGMRVRLR
jgi:hypothetical protein